MAVKPANPMARSIISLRAIFICTAAAFLAEALHFPIPYLLGPLFTTALLNSRGFPMPAPAVCRKAGLAVIGISLGLYFTPQMGVILAQNWPLLIGAMFFAVLLGAAGTVILYRFTDIDIQTAWYASAVGGASEIANIAEQNRVPLEHVVSAHSLRVLLVAGCVPFFYQFMGWHGTNTGAFSKNPDIYHLRLLLLLAIAYLGAQLFIRLRLSNPWTFGPLLITAAITLAGWHLSAIPAWLSHTAQILLGWSLGSKFGPGFFRRAPKFLTAVAASIAFAFLLTAIAAYGLSLIDHHAGAPAIGLGLSPGGVAEMTLTAKALQLSVPLVTAMHVMRMLAVVSTAAPIGRLLHKRFRQKKTAKTGG